MPLPLDREGAEGLSRAAQRRRLFYPRGGGGGTLSGTLSGVEGVAARLVVLPPGSMTGPPGTLPAGARVFESKIAGEPIRFDGIAWPVGAPGPYSS